MKDNFDCLITELQEDVNLIQEKGFAAFETKIINRQSFLLFPFYFDCSLNMVSEFVYNI